VWLRTRKNIRKNRCYNYFEPQSGLQIDYVSENITVNEFHLSDIRMIDVVFMTRLCAQQLEKIIRA